MSHFPYLNHVPRGQAPSTGYGKEDPRTPLLSSTFRERDPDDHYDLRNLRGRRWHVNWVQRHRIILLTLLGLMAGSSIIAILARRQIPSATASIFGEDVTNQAQAPKPDNSNTQEAPADVDPADPEGLSLLSIDALYARQSKTLEQAMARYTLKTRRSPPPNYERWFLFAQEKSCLIDEYDQIHRDFEPFYQLAKEYPTRFQEMVDRGSAVIEHNPVEIAVVEIKDGEVHITGPEVAYIGNWPITLGRFAAGLPDMKFLLNSRDEPRVVFNHQAPSARTKALSLNDLTPFEIAPRPTADFFKHHSGCIIPEPVPGFTSNINNDTAFLISSAKSGFTTDLYPLISMAKISPCFSDILFPTEYYYDQSWWSGKFAYPDNVPWEEKRSQIYWRGMSNGGQIIGHNYHQFPRFKLADMGREHPDLMDVAITRFAETLCLEGCDRDAVIKEYNITGDGQSREDIYGYKYAIDVDGTTFSGRYLGLLRSGSLVFKSTVFEEYFNDWLKPYEHYIPVLPDLSDLIEKIEWANTHQEEARLIQQMGLHFSRKVITDDQNDCYFFAVLLEWARLQSYAQDMT